MSDRKKDHLDLAFKARTGIYEHDTRFDYEPVLSGHPDTAPMAMEFLGKNIKAPLWISSMTGGTTTAGWINRNLAKACNEFGLGMGLGSCRVLLEDMSFLDDFNMRKIIGDDLPFYANLGISQLEKSLGEDGFDVIEEMVARLKADGLIIHVNPLQEWLQPEGDILEKPPLEVIQAFLEKTSMKLIVKEVGQGMGPESLRALMKLPLEALEFGAFGGTNFSRLELMRSRQKKLEYLYPLSGIGHTAEEMIGYINALTEKEEIKCKQVIISGGISSFLDGYYFINKSLLPAVYGQASVFLKYACGEYSELKEFIQYQINGLKIASSYLKIK